MVTIKWGQSIIEISGFAFLIDGTNSKFNHSDIYNCNFNFTISISIPILNWAGDAPTMEAQPRNRTNEKSNSHPPLPESLDSFISPDGEEL